MTFINQLISCLEFAGVCLWGWPLIIAVVLFSIASTLAFRGVQFRYFIASWRAIFATPPGGAKKGVSPIQAFFATLSTAMGNGSLAGMATAMYAGGPGAAFWVAVLSIITMPIRFAEVFAATSLRIKTKNGEVGGPFAYLSMVPGGKFLPYLYMAFCLCLSVITGNGMQCNAITGGVSRLTGIHPYFIAGVLLLFLVYTVLGGAQRIMKFSELVSPLKVILFMFCTLSVIIYNYDGILPALSLMMQSALTSESVVAGALGYSIKEAIRFGMSRTLSATEVGMGTAGVVYGAMKAPNSFHLSLMSMASTFLSVLVCFLMMLAFLVTGVWDSGLTSTPLVMATYGSLFGVFGSAVATLLSVLFGIGVLVAYAFVGLEAWMLLTGGRWKNIYFAIYCSMAIVGSLSSVELVWGMIDIIAAGLIITNLYGLTFLLPRLSRLYTKRLR